MRTPAPWLLAADEGVALRGGVGEIEKEIGVAGIIVAASFIASSSTTIVTGFALEAFVGLPLRGATVFWVSLGFLLLAK
jgi:hypothetical protein